MTKRSFVFYVLLFFLPYFGLSQNIGTICGIVSDATTGQPIANHPVTIVSDSSTGFVYSVTLYTTANGWYCDTLTNYVNIPQIMYVSTPDCNGSMQTAAVTLMSVTNVLQNFALTGCQTSSSCNVSFSHSISFTGNIVSFSDNSTGSNPLTYLWDFGDGNTSTQQNPIHTYNSPGTYTACLVITDNSGCSDTSCVAINILGGSSCSASFTSSVNPGGSVSFTNTSTVSSNVSVHWDFGDGNTSSAYSPTHTYAQSGVYTVCLTIWDANLSCNDTLCDVVVVTIGGGGGNCNPTLNVGAVGMGIYGSGQPPSTGGNIVSWTWSFGDGTGGSGQYVNHTYGSLGTYIVCLTTVDANGCTGQTCDSVTICSFADFTYYLDTTAGPPYTYQFINQSAGVQTNIMWDFGDGNTSTQQNPVHTYANPGTYTVLLLIDDGQPGWVCWDSATVTLVIGSGGGTNCQADFSVSNTPTNPCTFGFFDQSTGVNSWYWDFGDGTTSLLQNPTHTYAASGVYTVMLIAGNSTTVCADTMLVTLTVQCNTGGNCAANFTATPDTAVVMGYPYFFTNTSTGNFTNSYWDFGDGNTSTQTHPYHVYTSPGTYYVSLLITDNLTGCSDTLVFMLVVQGMGGNCQASFTVSTDSTGTAVFVGSATTNAVTWDWDFGDGNTGTGQTVTHVYGQSGNYWACLTITDANGCTDTYCGAVYVPNPSGLYNIGGMVFASNSPVGNGPADEYTVYLIVLDQIALTLTAIDSMTVSMAAGDTGFYMFTGVPSGSYTTKAALNPSSAVYWNFVPTYYGDDMFWSNANYVALFSDRYNVDINMIAGNNPGGPGFIGGSVLTGANKTGDPLHHIEIILLDMSNNPIAYTYSDINGDWSFPNLAYGTYQIYTEVMNKQTIPEIVTIGPNTPTIDDVLIEVHSTFITGIDLDESIYFSNVGDLYPNPTNASASFDLELKEFTTLSIQVMNAVGQEVMRIENPYAAGNHTITLSTENLKAGMYFVSILAEDTERVVLKLMKE